MNKGLEALENLYNGLTLYYYKQFTNSQKKIDKDYNKVKQDLYKLDKIRELLEVPIKQMSNEGITKIVINYDEFKEELESKKSFGVFKCKKCGNNKYERTLTRAKGHTFYRCSKCYTEVTELQHYDIISKLTTPTAEEVCKALSRWLGEKIVYEYGDFFNERKTASVCQSNGNKEYKIDAFLPPKIITLIGRFYEGEEK